MADDKNRNSNYIKNGEQRLPFVPTDHNDLLRAADKAADDGGAFGADSFRTSTERGRRAAQKDEVDPDSYGGIGGSGSHDNDSDHHHDLVMATLANPANFYPDGFFENLDNAQSAFDQEIQNKITISIDNPFADLSLTEEDQKIEKAVYQNNNGEYFYIGDNGEAKIITDANQLDQINRQVAEGKLAGDMKTAQAEQNLKTAYTGNDPSLFDPFDKSGTETYAAMTGDTTQNQEHLTLEMQERTLAEQFKRAADTNGILSLKDVDDFARKNPDVSMGKIAAIIGNEGLVLNTSGDQALQKQYSSLIDDNNIVKVPDYTNDDVAANYSGVDDLGPKNRAEELAKKLEEQQLRLAREQQPQMDNGTQPIQRTPGTAPTLGLGAGPA